MNSLTNIAILLCLLALVYQQYKSAIHAGAGKARLVGGTLAKRFKWLTEARFLQGFLLGVALALVVLGAGKWLPNVNVDWKWPSWVVDVLPDPKPKGDLRVLFVRETSAKLTPEQEHAFNSTKIAAYLNAKCVKVDGRAEWRRWDKDVDVTHESADWQQRWASVKGTLPTSPCMVIFRGEHATITGADTEAEALASLEKYGG